MTSIMRRLQNQILTNINNAAAIDCGYDRGLVLHGLFLNQDKSEKEPIGASLTGRFS